IPAVADMAVRVHLLVRNTYNSLKRDYAEDDLPKYLQEEIAKVAGISPDRIDKTNRKMTGRSDVTPVIRPSSSLTDPSPAAAALALHRHLRRAAIEPAKANAEQADGSDIGKEPKYIV